MADFPVHFGELMAVLSNCIPCLEHAAHKYYEGCLTRIGLWYIFLTDSAHVTLASIALADTYHDLQFCNGIGVCCAPRATMVTNLIKAYFTLQLFQGYWRYCGGWCLLFIEFFTLAIFELELGATLSLEVALGGTFYMFGGDNSNFEKDKFRKVMKYFRPWTWIISIVSNGILAYLYFFHPDVNYTSCEENSYSCSEQDFSQCSSQEYKMNFSTIQEVVVFLGLIPAADMLTKILCCCASAESIAGRHNYDEIFPL